MSQIKTIEATESVDLLGIKIDSNLNYQLPMQELFTEKNDKYDLRNKRSWESYNVRTVSYGTETIRYSGPKIWELVPTEIKESASLAEF